MFRARRLTRERIVFVLLAAPVLASSPFFPGFSCLKNTRIFGRNVYVLGTPGVATVLAVIGQGIDLSFGARMATMVLG
jgi:ribose/xylose/arabinose/galactoside ABC-type transport system permease subunit